MCIGRSVQIDYISFYFYDSRLEYIFWSFNVYFGFCRLCILEESQNLLLICIAKMCLFLFSIDLLLFWLDRVMGTVLSPNRIMKHSWNNSTIRVSWFWIISKGLAFYISLSSIYISSSKFSTFTFKILRFVFDFREMTSQPEEQYQQKKVFDLKLFRVNSQSMFHTWADCDFVLVSVVIFILISYAHM